MQAETFEDLVTSCVTSGAKHRMLYVFVRIGAMDEETKAAMLGDDAADEEAGFVQILFDAHQPASHGLTFDSVRDAADAHSKEWDLVVIGLAKNSDDSLPTEKQAHAFLSDMRERILAGNIADLTIMDRDGNPVSVDTEEVPGDDGPVH